MITDGTSLLGADDKAGVVEIMEAVKYLIEHPEIKHGRIRIAFTPDEEIGRGPHKFDVERFNADFAYTMDGSEFGELQFESFNAAEAKITTHGVNVHPGSAKTSWSMLSHYINFIVYPLAKFLNVRKTMRILSFDEFEGNVEKQHYNISFVIMIENHSNYVRKNY